MIICDLQVSGSVYKAVLAHSHAHLFIVYGCFLLMAELNIVMETMGLQRTKYLLSGLYRNSLLIPAQSLRKVSRMLHGVFTVDSVYDLIWLHLQTSYTSLLFSIITLLGKQK